MHTMCTPQKSRVSQFQANTLNLLARLAGFEPATYGLEVRCSIQLSYRRSEMDGVAMRCPPSFPPRLRRSGSELAHLGPTESCRVRLPPQALFYRCVRRTLQFEPKARTGETPVPPAVSGNKIA